MELSCVAVEFVDFLSVAHRAETTAVFSALWILHRERCVTVL